LSADMHTVIGAINPRKQSLDMVSYNGRFCLNHETAQLFSGASEHSWHMMKRVVFSRWEVYGNVGAKKSQKDAESLHQGAYENASTEILSTGGGKCKYEYCR